MQVSTIINPESGRAYWLIHTWYPEGIALLPDAPTSLLSCDRYKYWVAF